MKLFHRFFAKLGHSTEADQVKQFLSAHPHSIVIDTRVHDALGEKKDSMELEWKTYRISNITGDGVFFAKKKQKAYIAVGKAEMELQLDEYINRHTPYDKFHGIIIELASSARYHIVFDARPNGTYRIRYHDERQELQIIYELGDEHKIYSFS